MKIEQFQQSPEQVRVLDVRSPKEWEHGHVAGSVLIPLDELADRLGELEQGAALVAICRTGVRSQKAMDLLIENGFRAESLDGGVTAWAAAGKELIRPDGQPGAVLAPALEPEYLPPEQAKTRDTFLEVIFGLQQRYGMREPTDEEAKAFMREWLAEKGKTPEEIERTLADN